MQPHPDQPAQRADYITLNEASAWTGIPRQTLYEASQTPAIRTYRFTGPYGYRINREDLIDYYLTH